MEGECSARSTRNSVLTQATTKSPSNKRQAEVARFRDNPGPEGVDEERPCRNHQ